MHREARFFLASLPILGSLALGACDGRHANAVLDPLPPATIDPAAPPLSYSAPTMFAVAIGSTAQIDTEPHECPVDREEGGTHIREGGCTDESGREWFGRLTYPVSPTPGVLASGTIVYQGFGSSEPTECADRPDATARQLLDGTVEVRSTETGLTFDADIVITNDGVQDDCSEEPVDGAFRYSGTMTQAGERNTWSGSGSLGSEAIGRYEISTEDEVIDDTVCESEALSGTTTISGDHVVVVTYDGATDCDEDSTITWTLDGVDQGEASGIQCSASPGRSAPPWLALAGLAGALAWRVRRRSAR